jgi:DNA-binding transcriptional ArsR family regulator
MTGTLARALPELSRFAVMQHLSVLEEAGLVLARREGRKRLNYLNPVPLREVYERWISSHASTAAETVLRLKRYAEQPKENAQEMDQSSFRMVEIELELEVKASAQRVFDALTREYNEWWPHRYKPDSEVFCECEVGGKIGERFKSGGGALYGEVLYLDEPNAVVTGGASCLCRGFTSYSSDKLVATEAGCTLKRKFQLWGVITEETEKMFREGSTGILNKALKNYLENAVGYVAQGAVE